MSVASEAADSPTPHPRTPRASRCSADTRSGFQLLTQAHLPPSLACAPSPSSVPNRLQQLVTTPQLISVGRVRSCDTVDAVQQRASVPAKTVNFDQGLLDCASIAARQPTH